MRKKLFNVLKFLGFLAIGVFFLWLVYRDQSLDEMLKILSSKVTYSWIWLSLFFGILSHISRTIRWIMLIEPLGKKPGIMNTFFAVMTGYLANLALPRMGEISRCGVLGNYEKIPFPKLVGTVVTERIIDLIMLGLFLLVVVFTQFPFLIRFLEDNPEIGANVQGVLNWKIWALILASIVASFFLFRASFKHTLLYHKIMDFSKSFYSGIKTVGKLEKKFWFIFHTVFIWAMYYLMTYVCFFAFKETSDLTPFTGLTTFVMGSFGMVAPVQGGLGPWHFMVIATLKLYGVPGDIAGSFALIVHSAQTLMLIIVGFISLIALPVYNNGKMRKAKLHAKE